MARNVVVPISVLCGFLLRFSASAAAVVGLAASAFAAAASGPATCLPANVISIWGGARHNIFLTAVVSLGGSGYHSVVLRMDGSVWAWGLGTSGQLGDGNMSTSNVPVHVLGLPPAQAVTSGYASSLALLPDHTLRSWGSNSNGQLG